MPPLSDSEDLTGRDVGGFTIDSLLAVGGMGRVFKARAPDGTEVALKLVKSDLAADGVFRKRFEREAPHRPDGEPPPRRAGAGHR